MEKTDVFGIYSAAEKRINHLGLVREVRISYLITVEGNSNDRMESRRRHLKTIYAFSNWVGFSFKLEFSSHIFAQNALKLFGYRKEIGGLQKKSFSSAYNSFLPFWLESLMHYFNQNRISSFVSGFFVKPPLRLFK